MTCRKLIEYLSEFEPESRIAIIIGDPEKRISHKVRKVFLLIGEAALMLETVESEPLDDIGEK